VQLTATGIEPVENGAGHVAHSWGVWTVGHVERNLGRALSVRTARTGLVPCGLARPSDPPAPSSRAGSLARSANHRRLLPEPS
jgi:hypothetical protein